MPAMNVRREFGAITGAGLVDAGTVQSELGASQGRSNVAHTVLPARLVVTPQLVLSLETMCRPRPLGLWEVESTGPVGGCGEASATRRVREPFWRITDTAKGPRA